MRPLKLELSGFTCFREPTAVSFEELELFAISGVTGAGKSTLLDAITYALYGQTARLGTRVGETLFSPDLDKLSVQLTFGVGHETFQVTRVSERKGARGPKNETRLERLGPDAQWRQLSESEKLKDADRKIAEIVGLSYDNFTRAVLLPQGDFDRFLHAKPGDRTNLLRDLLGLSITGEMQKRAGQTARDAEARGRAIEERLTHDYAEATPERRRALSAERAALDEERTSLAEARQALAERVQALRALQALLDERAGVQRRLAGLEAQRSDDARDRARLAQAQDADKLLPYLDDLETHRRKAAGLSDQRSRSAQAVASAERDFAAAQTALAKAEQGAQRLPELAERTEGLAEARVLFAQLTARRGTLALPQESAETYTDAAWDALQAQQQQLPALERARGEVTDTQMRRNQAQRSRDETETARGAAQKSLTALEAAGKNAKTRKETAEQAYDEAARVAPAAALRPHLHVGEACPVCEQTVAVLPPPVSGDLEALGAARSSAVNAYNELRERYIDEKSTLKTLTARLADEMTQLQRAEDDLQHRQQQLEELAEALGASDPARLRAELGTRQRALLAGLAAQIWAKTGGLDPEQAHAELTRERSRLEAARLRAQSAFHEAQRTLDRLQADAAGLAARVQEAAEAHAQAERIFTELLSRTSFAGPDALRAAALPAPAQQKLATETERYAHDLEQFTRQDEELGRRLAGQTLAAGALEAAALEQRQTDARLGEVQSRMGALEGELKRLEGQLETAKKLRAERGELEKTASLYGTLSRDLMVNHFPAYMLERVQDDLAQRASDILKTVTEQRYDLYFRGDEYVVLDAWTGSERSARTLSGGESFITSLALALALSDTLSGSTSLGALFLDEGFGTLDAETLEGVAKVLESLTAHGRMVGVITHVAALTERLPARLVVSKGMGGSVVAWE